MTELEWRRHSLMLTIGEWAALAIAVAQLDGKLGYEIGQQVIRHGRKASSLALNFTDSQMALLRALMDEEDV